MRSTVASALLGLGLLGCSSCTSSTASSASTPAQPAAAQQGIHQISPVRPPPGLMGLQVALQPHAPGATCDQLLVNGARSDLPTLTETARNAVARNPNVSAQVSADPACSAADTQKVVEALRSAGVKDIAQQPSGSHGASALPGAPPSDAERAAAQGTNAFAAELYGQLAKASRGNLAFSPASVAGALALVDVGAAGQTASALDAALHTGLPHDQSVQALAALMQRYQAGSGDTTLDIANRIWAAQHFELKPSYLQAVQQGFGAAAQQVDFSQAEAARAEINAWVSQQTRNKITELIAPNALNASTEFVLTNAVYFFGAWKNPFDPAKTVDAPFTLEGGEKVQVPMMHQFVNGRGAHAGGVQVVELPYGQRGTLAFDLIVPDAKDGLAAVESGLTPAWLAQTLNGLQAARVTLAMPRFKERSQFALAKPLAALGLGGLFSGPDLSAMTPAAGASISAVVHQAFVDVSEKGTEAAAATAVIGTRMFHRELELNLTADHPFLYVIRDTATGGILFMGRVADPRS